MYQVGPVGTKILCPKFRFPSGECFKRGSIKRKTFVLQANCFGLKVSIIERGSTAFPL